MFKQDAESTITPFPKKVYLSSPTMHGDELRYMAEAFETNWMSTVGANIDAVEAEISQYLGIRYAVGLASGTSALHLAVKLAGVKPGDFVLCSDMTFAATVNPVVYEGGIPVFVDTERETWNMCPEALEKAFEHYPSAKVVVIAHLYGTPAKMDEILAVAHAHGAFVIEDAAESLGATYKGAQTGTLGDIAAISFNGNKIITGSSGGMLLTNDEHSAFLARKWSTQSREPAPWYQHEDMGYNYRMSNVIAGVVRGQLPYLEEHIAQKSAIYNRYEQAFAATGLSVLMNPFEKESSVPNHWLSCMLIGEDAMCSQALNASDYSFKTQSGKSCPMEILEAIAAINAEGRPIWKPMHMQPIYVDNPFVSCVDGASIGEDIFHRGLCLPSDNKMTAEQQDAIIETIKRCFA